MAVVNNEQHPSPAAKKYGKVAITLENVLIPKEKLLTTPSQQDRLDREIECDLRITGCELITMSGILLKLPQVAMASGQVLFQRFYYAKSLVRYPMETTAMACIALASKIEEAPRKIRDVINVFNHIKQVKNGKTIQPVILDSNYISLKNEVIKAERRLLKELGFCCHVKHPHKIIIMYLRLLDAENHKKLAQSSWNYMNDALRTDVFVRYSPETIACACIWLAGRFLKFPLPDNPPWYHIFKVSVRDIEEISASILKLYVRKKAKLELLESKVDEIRKIQQEARLRNKACPLTTPKEVNATFSPASRNNSPKQPGLKRSSSPDRNAGKRSGSSRSSSRSNSHSPPRHSRKKMKGSRHSHSRSRSRSHSRDRYHSKKRYSITPSPTVTPPPRFTKNKEKGSIVRSVSRSRSHSPIHYDKHDKYSSRDKYEKSRKIERYEKNEKYFLDDHLDRRMDHKKNDKYGKLIDKMDKKKSERDLKREARKYYDNGYEKHHKSKKSSRQRSRSRDRDRRR